MATKAEMLKKIDGLKMADAAFTPETDPDPGMKLIAVTYSQTPEVQKQTFEAIHSISANENAGSLLKIL